MSLIHGSAWGYQPVGHVDSDGKTIHGSAWSYRPVGRRDADGTVYAGRTALGRVDADGFVYRDDKPVGRVDHGGLVHDCVDGYHPIGHVEGQRSSEIEGVELSGAALLLLLR